MRSGPGKTPQSKGVEAQGVEAPYCPPFKKRT
jgi:hypothetical protein